MRYMITLRVTAQPDTPPPAELMRAKATLGEEAAKSGALLDNGGLAPSAQGARIELTGGHMSVADGPFPDVDELAGYAVYQVAGKDEAVEWGSRFLALHRDLWPGWEGRVDVLRIFGPEDFGAPR
ncbi:YciI family protein [Spongiactinospora sp. 9N601]|uniref:YciI family protein n=1 Tax=Spongiactinospora sp. 9N601 TaxID=3375149 RepID=UPI003788C924